MLRSQFLATSVNAHDPADTFQVERSGDEYLVVIKDNKVGTTYKDGGIQIGGVLLSANLTCVKQTDTILGQGFWGPIEFKRKK